AFFFGNDHGDYFRASGFALSSRRELPRNGAVELSASAFAEVQRSVEKGTDISLPHWTRDRTFRPNPAIDSADQIGLDLSVRARHGLDPNGFRGAATLSTRAEAGSFSFLKPSAEFLLT